LCLSDITIVGHETFGVKQRVAIILLRSRISGNGPRLPNP